MGEVPRTSAADWREHAEAVCRRYLSNGRRAGPLLAGRRCPQHAGPLDVRPAQRTMPGTRRGGQWTDAATGEHGDLLDVIRESCGLVDFGDVADEARRFLSLPRPSRSPPSDRDARSPAPIGSPEAARRLFAMSQPIRGTLVETYLRGRGITALHGTGSAALPSALLLSARRRMARPRPGRR